MFYGATYVLAALTLDSDVGTPDSIVSFAPALSLFSCTLYYSLAIAVRAHAESQSSLSRWLHSWIVCLFATSAITFPFTINVLWSTTALFVVARLLISDGLVDEEAPNSVPTAHHYGIQYNKRWMQGMR